MYNKILFTDSSDEIDFNGALANISDYNTSDYEELSENNESLEKIDLDYFGTVFIKPFNTETNTTLEYNTMAKTENPESETLELEIEFDGKEFCEYECEYECENECECEYENEYELDIDTLQEIHYNNIEEENIIPIKVEEEAIEEAIEEETIEEEKETPEDIGSFLDLVTRIQTMPRRSVLNRKSRFGKIFGSEEEKVNPHVFCGGQKKDIENHITTLFSPFRSGPSAGMEYIKWNKSERKHDFERKKIIEKLSEESNSSEEEELKHTPSFMPLEDPTKTSLLAKSFKPIKWNVFGGFPKKNRNEFIEKSPEKNNELLKTLEKASEKFMKKNKISKPELEYDEIESGYCKCEDSKLDFDSDIESDEKEDINNFKNSNHLDLLMDEIQIPTGIKISEKDVIDHITTEIFRENMLKAMKIYVGMYYSIETNESMKKNMIYRMTKKCFLKDQENIKIILSSFFDENIDNVIASYFKYIYMFSDD